VSIFHGPIDAFRHCPACGADVAERSNPLECRACGFSFFFNPTVAAAAFIFDGDGRALFIRRAKEPAKGMLGLPGGFVDIGECAEDAVRREIREEVDLDVVDLAYLTSCPNFYSYRGVTYPVCDLIFTAAAIEPGQAKPLDGVAGLEWQRVAHVDPEELAFPSMRQGCRLLQSR